MKTPHSKRWRVCGCQGRLEYIRFARRIPSPLRFAGLPPSLRFGATSRRGRSAANATKARAGRRHYFFSEALVEGVLVLSSMEAELIQ